MNPNHLGFWWKKEVSFIEDAASASLDVAATPVLAFLAAWTAEVDADDCKAAAKAELAVETGLVVAATEAGLVVAAESEAGAALVAVVAGFTRAGAVVAAVDADFA